MRTTEGPRDQTDRMHMGVFMKALLTILLILLFCVGPGEVLAGSISKRQKVSQTHRDRANELMGSGDLCGAIDQYRKAIEAAEPDSAAIHSELGIALAEAGQ